LAAADANPRSGERLHALCRPPKAPTHPPVRLSTAGRCCERLRQARVTVAKAHARVLANAAGLAFAGDELTFGLMRSIAGAGFL
jgi:hypothetical protein